jgi:ribosome biogenesis GTPase
MRGIIVKVMGRYYTVRAEERNVTSVLRGKIRQDESMKRFSEPAAVGDGVEISIDSNESGLIEKVYERRNVFTRKDKGRKKEDLIAANIGQIVIVLSFYKPAYNLRFSDRICVRAVKENIPILLCVNKSDLSQKSEIKYIKDYYKNSGLDIIFTSAKTGDGIDKLYKKLKGKVSLFTGSSGAGKSSLLNCICPDIDLKIAEISESTGKGKHTTTNVQMIRSDSDTWLVDTPGMREFGLMDITPDELADFFPDFKILSKNCRFSPCTHDHEPGCEVKNNVDSGNILNDRYISYLNILQNIRDSYSKMYD